MMLMILDRLKTLIRNDAGQDLAEYGMLSALIAVVVIGAIAILGGSLVSVWNTITNALSALP